MNNAETALIWIANQIPDFEPKSKEDKMLLVIKQYCTAGADEIARLTAENERLQTENTKIDEYRCVIDDISEQCRELEAENSELKARLEKAVELPVKVGDTIYEILVSVHREWIVKEIKICEIWTKIDAQEKSSGAHWRFDLKDYNETWFTDPDRAKAEAELKGGEGE